MRPLLFSTPTARSMRVSVTGTTPSQPVQNGGLLASSVDDLMVHHSSRFQMYYCGAYRSLRWAPYSVPNAFSDRNVDDGCFDRIFDQVVSAARTARGRV